MKTMKQTYVYRYIKQRVSALLQQDLSESEKMDILIDEISERIYIQSINNHRSLDEQINVVMQQQKQYIQKYL